MKNTLLILPFFCISCVLISSCSSSKNALTSRYYFNFENRNLECKHKEDQIYLFYEGDSLDFEYIQLGEINVSPGNHTMKKDLKTLIKYDAWNNCADAVICLPTSLKKVIIYKIDSDLLFIPDFEQRIKCFTIKINKDSAFINKYGNVKDTSFVERGKALKEASNKALKNEQTSNLGIVVLILTGLGILYILFLIAFFNTFVNALFHSYGRNRR